MRDVRENEEVREEVAEEKKTKLGVLKVGEEIIRPYEGKSKLPPDKLDAKGNVLAVGEARHFVARHGNDYKLIRVYRAKGVKHALVRMVKPRLKDKPEEKAFFNELKRHEIPGAI